MKYLVSVLLASTAIVHGDGYINSIRQTNVFEDGQGALQETFSLMSDVSSSDTDEAQTAVMGRSIFELVATDRLTGVEELLDTTVVSSYLADGTVTIIGPTADPYNHNLGENGVPRTQVGQGFTVVYEVSGLEDPNVPPANGGSWPYAATNLRVQHKTVNSFNGDVNFNQSSIEENGVHSLPHNTAIAKASPSAPAGDVSGIERFDLILRGDSGYPASRLDSAKIKVFPRVRGGLQGIVSGKKYDYVPPLQVDVANMYPGSSAYVRVTGDALAEPIIVGNRVNTRGRALDVDFSLKSLDKLLVDDGLYTIELLYTDVYTTAESGAAGSGANGPNLNAAVSIANPPPQLNLQRNLQVKGGVFTSE